MNKERVQKIIFPQEVNKLKVGTTYRILEIEIIDKEKAADPYFIGWINELKATTFIHESGSIWQKEGGVCSIRFLPKGSIPNTISSDFASKIIFQSVTV
jgi:hypothetical protein